MSDVGLHISYRGIDDPYQGSPMANFTTSPLDHAKVNGTIVFDASGSWDPDGQVVQYNWDFSDGVVENVTESITVHKFSTPGTFDVVLRVVDDHEILSEPATRTLNISPLIPPIAFFRLSNEKFPPNLVIFNASGSYDPDGSIVSYVWDFGDGSPAVKLTEPTVQHRFDWGLFNVTLTVIDNDDLQGSLTLLSGQLAGPASLDVLYGAMVVVSVTIAGLAGLFMAHRFFGRSGRAPESGK